MPAGIETFANQPTASVTAGGTTTSDTAFTVTTNDSWPAASSTSTPNNFFRIVDQADTSEIMIVTTAPGGNSAGQSWTVTRGAEGSTAVAHTAGWTAVQVVTAGTLQNFQQASNATTTPLTITSATETVVASYQPVSIDIEAGATFEAIAFGVHSVAGVATAASRQMTWTLRWGGLAGTILCRIITGTNAASIATTAVAGSSFDVNGSVTLITTTSATANINLFYTNSTNSLTVAQATAQATNATAGAASSATAVTISGSGPLVLTAFWGAGTGVSLTATAPVVYRAA